MNHEPSALFGLDPLWISGALFVLTYAAILSERINRAVVALLGAGLMIITGVLNQAQAVAAIEFNTLGLLTGMMVIVAVMRKSGVFQYVAIWSAKRVEARPWRVLLMLSLITALFSAFLDNVTTVLLVAPVTLIITEALGVKPYPFLFAEILSSNIGGTATLIGDPPNVMIGSAVGLTFNDFLFNLAPIVPVILAATLVPLYLLWGHSMRASEAARQRVMRFDEREAITDVRLLRQGLAVLALVMLGFIFAHPLGLEPATTAMFGAALLLLLHNYPLSAQRQSESVQRSFDEVEWITIFFFVGLFILVAGIERSGLLERAAQQVLEWTGGDPRTLTMAVVWTSALASTVVDNIPFVATMIPLIESMGPALGGAEALKPLWWALALGACLGGNGSLVGASANLIVAGFAERAGHPIHFLPFMALALPLMLMSVAIASLYLWLRYL